MSITLSDTQPLGNSSYENIENFFDKTGNTLTSVKDVLLLLLKQTYGGDSKFLNKILLNYRSDCVFRKELRNATLNIVNSTGIIYSLNKDKKCISNIDKVFIASILSYTSINIINVVRKYVR